MRLVAGFDVVVDCTDNLAARYLISDACVLGGKPLVSGAAQARATAVPATRPLVARRAVVDVFVSLSVPCHLQSFQSKLCYPSYAPTTPPYHHPSPTSAWNPTSAGLRGSAQRLLVPAPRASGGAGRCVWGDRGRRARRGRRATICG